MAKLTAKQLDIGNEWRDWGDRLGWRYVHCMTDSKDDHAVFDVDGRKEKIRLTTRQALQRQDKPEIKAVSNG